MTAALICRCENISLSLSLSFWLSLLRIPLSLDSPCSHTYPCSEDTLSLIDLSFFFKQQTLYQQIHLQHVDSEGHVGFDQV